MARSILCNQWAHGPQHVLGDVVLRVGSSEKAQIGDLATRAAESVAARVADGIGAVDPKGSVGNDFMAAVLALLQRKAVDVKAKHWCYKCKKDCVVHGHLDAKRLLVPDATSAAVCVQFLRVLFRHQVAFAYHHLLNY